MMTNKQTEINQLLTANGGSWFFCVCSEGVVRFCSISSPFRLS